MMKQLFIKILPLFLVLSSSFFAPPQAAAQFASYPFGINWMNTDTTLHGHHWQKFCDDTLGFNIQHTGGDAKNGFNGLIAWSKLSSDKIIAVNGNDAIDRFSGAEFMKYACTPKPATTDTLTNFYFIRSDTVVGNYNSTLNEWQINKDLTGSYKDTVVMDSNEVLNGNTDYNVTWRDGTNMAFKLAVKLQVASLTGATDSTILTITVTQRRYTNYTSAYTDTVAKIWKIKWDSIKTVNSDTVLFSPTFHFPYPLGIDNPNVISDVKLSLSSERWVTTRIAWTCVEDTLADSLLAGAPPPLGLDGSRADLKKISDTTVWNEIRTAADYVSDSTNHNLLYYYLHDEPQISEFTAQGRVNFILNDSGETERSIYQERRYAAQVLPQTFRSASGFKDVIPTAVIAEKLPVR